MASLAQGKDERKPQTIQMESIGIEEKLEDEDIVGSYYRLQAEESNLTDQKDRLKTLLKQLEARAREEVDKKKRKVERLNSEVLDLKRKCEKYAKCVNSGPTVESNHTGF